MKRIAVRISNELHERLGTVAKERGLKVSEVVRWGIADFAYRLLKSDTKMSKDEGQDKG